MNTPGRDPLAAYSELAERAATRGLAALDDTSLLALLRRHRWAVGRLAWRRLRPDQRARLQHAAVRAHGALHRRAGRRHGHLGSSLRAAWRGLVLSGGAFVTSAILAFAAVAAEPLVAYSLIDRALLAEIDASYWGGRAGTQADVGMTFYYWGHNLQAAFLALSIGILGGVPALIIVAYNGALLGAIAAASLERGAGMRLLQWVAPHGVPELAGLMICGAMGWELGRSWLVPQAHLRRVALADCGQRLTPLVLAAALLIIAAAPLEGFIAPLAMPPWADACIAGCWVALLATSAAHALRAERR